jgi:DNA-binding CsgD family transcriptional regulator
MIDPTTQSPQAPGSLGLVAKALLGARAEAPRLKRLFDYSPVPMVMADAKRRYVEVNRPGRLALRLSREEVSALTIDDLTPSSLTPDLEQAWARLLDTGSVAGSYQVAGRAGHRLEIVYYGLAEALPGLQLVAFAPADWLEDELFPTDEDLPDPTVPLTPREIQVLALAAEGHSGPELAGKLVLSPATVNTHFKNIYKKLRVRTRAAAVAKAMRLGVID